MPEIGQTVSHYKTIEKISRGGRGEVCPAEDRHTSHQVALEVLGHEYTHDAVGLDCFEREVMLLLREESQGM
jgi:serine/threonine protein kinase